MCHALLCWHTPSCARASVCMTTLWPWPGKSVRFLFLFFYFFFSRHYLPDLCYFFPAGLAPQHLDSVQRQGWVAVLHPYGLGPQLCCAPVCPSHAGSAVGTEACNRRLRLFRTFIWRLDRLEIAISLSSGECLCFYMNRNRLPMEQMKTWTRLVASSMHSGKKAVQITTTLIFQYLSFLCLKMQKMRKRERVICEHLHLRVSRSSKFPWRAPGPLSPHRSAVISGPKCYKIMPSLLLLSINNNCTQIQQSHVERLALNICMCVSTRFETQIILIILHEISFSFPNLALVHVLPVACRGPLLYFPVQLFPQKLLTRALAGHCVKPYHAPLRVAEPAALGQPRSPSPGSQHLRRRMTERTIQC